MPLSPESRAVMDLLAAVYPRVDETGDPVACRAALAAIPPLDVDEVRSVVDRTVPGLGPTDPEVAVRIYHPATTDDPVGILVYLHGGGWVLGSLDTHDNVARTLANAAEVVVVSVDYRLAPEHPHPAPLDDTMAVLRWVHDHAAELGAPDVVALGGDSAGGNLAAAATLRARDEDGPPIAFQLLVYPVTDSAMDTVSYREFGTDHFLTAAGMAWYWNAYRADPAGRAEPLCSPLRATDVTGLPPALVITASCDPLRDEGEAYAARLQTAGVATTAHRQDDTFHGFFSLPGTLFAPAGEAQDLAATTLRAALAGETASSRRSADR
jgi:acetyl esterase